MNKNSLPLIKQMELLPRWQLLLFLLFMEAYSAAWHLAKRAGLIKPSVGK